MSSGNGIPEQAMDTARVGLSVTLGPGEEHTHLTSSDLPALGLRRLRAVLRRSDWERDVAAGAALLEALTHGAEVLPCLVLDHVDRPGDPAELVEALLQRSGPEVPWVEVCVERVEQAADAAQVARRARELGRRVVVSTPAQGGEAALRAAPLERADAVGVDLEGAPEDGWRAAVTRARAALPGCPAWVVGASRPTYPHDELEQARALLAAASLPAERCYWATARDGAPREEGGPPDPQSRSQGLLFFDGRPKLAARLLAARGLAALREVLEWTRRTALEVHGGEPPVLITGGAGFVGTNLAARLLAAGRRVVLYDDLSRRGVEHNARWLQETWPDAVRLVVADVRDRARLRRALEGTGEVFHLAGQVAVTTSLVHPTVDFEVNALGTHVLLEELRLRKERGQGPRSIVFTSTNKVYGSLPDLPLVERATRWEPADPVVRAAGISEAWSLDLHSPYGCSKGAADQYVLEYARTFGLPGVVFRMSCIYGPRQLGTPDQGWVSQFALCALQGEPLTIYGDGKQVRDVLHVDDLVDALLLAAGRADALAGTAFNIGGGPVNTVSLLELLQLLRALGGRTISTGRAECRPGDQRYYVSDTARFRAATGWAPRVGVRAGVARLVRWLMESPSYARRARSA